MDEQAGLSARASGHWSQFSLRTVFLALTAVAVALSLRVWLGRDGWLLAAILVPLFTVPWYVGGPVSRNVRITLAVTLLTLGVVWRIGFPKSTDLLRPYVLGSTLVGIGFVGSGAILMAVRKRAVLSGLAVALLCSALLNIFLINYLLFLRPFLMQLRPPQWPAAAPSSGTNGKTDQPPQPPVVLPPNRQRPPHRSTSKRPGDRCLGDRAAHSLPQGAADAVAAAARDQGAVRGHVDHLRDQSHRPIPQQEVGARGMLAAKIVRMTARIGRIERGAEDSAGRAVDPCHGADPGPVL
jgi:hypothetical protein